MNFISLEYWLFFLLSATLYYVLRGRAQMLWLVGCSVFFYSVYNPVFLLVLTGQLLIDYVAGLRIGQSEKGRKAWLLASIGSNLGILVGFKYLAWLLGLGGYSFSAGAIVPLGLSFHTFQGIAYTTDVYRRQVRPERDFFKFCNYIFFFPQLVAGPIERPAHFLPQVVSKRFSREDFIAGTRLILWGLVQKMVIADRLAQMADPVFARPQGFSALATWIGLAAFTLQILADFSGYTDIARGCARILGYDLSLNFNSPYAATSLADFWRRWHISLSSWFRDYVYKPLGGAQVGAGRRAANILVVFGLSGLWHGAQTTFLLWGLYHGLGLVAERLAGLPKRASALYTVPFVMLGWVLFRASSVPAALKFYGSLFRMPALPSWAMLQTEFGNGGNIKTTALVTLAYLMVQAAKPWLEALAAVYTPLRWAGYYLAVLLILMLSPVNNPVFIYFQF